MTRVRAKDGERLDQIVYRHYGHLRFFEKVLELNSKLAPILRAGDEVLLPELKNKSVRKERALW